MSTLALAVKLIPTTTTETSASVFNECLFIFPFRVSAIPKNLIVCIRASLFFYATIKARQDITLYPGLGHLCALLGHPGGLLFTR
jgi:hypothetical protein